MVHEATIESGDEYELPDDWILPREGLLPIWHAAVVARTVELAQQSGAQTVLEVGCGDGWDCAQLVKAGMKVAGIDRSRNGVSNERLLVPEGDFKVCDYGDATYKTRFASRSTRCCSWK